MSNILVEWNSNWADEMDVEGWSVLSEEEVSDLKTNLNNREGNFSVYIGTNEDITYSCGKDMLDELTFKEISYDESNVLTKLFGGNYGHTNFLNML